MFSMALDMQVKSGTDAESEQSLAQAGKDGVWAVSFTKSKLYQQAMRWT